MQTEKTKDNELKAKVLILGVVTRRIFKKCLRR